MLSLILLIIVALLHVYFFALESYCYTSKLGRAIFALNDEKIKYTQVLAFNQGYYNLCWALGIFAGIFLHNQELLIFVLSSLILLGLIGGFSFSRKILYLQSFPALVALIVLLLKR